MRHALTGSIAVPGLFQRVPDKEVPGEATFSDPHFRHKALSQPFIKGGTLPENAMNAKFLLALAITILPLPALAQSQSAHNTPQETWEIDSQARAAKPGTVTSPNPDQPAIAKIEAAGKNPNPGPPVARTHQPAGPATGENNSGGR